MVNGIKDNQTLQFLDLVGGPFFFDRQIGESKYLKCNNSFRMRDIYVKIIILHY